MNDALQRLAEKLPEVAAYREWCLDADRDGYGHYSVPREIPEAALEACAAEVERLNRTLRLIVGEYRKQENIDRIISDDDVLAELRAQVEEASDD